MKPIAYLIASFASLSVVQGQHQTAYDLAKTPGSAVDAPDIVVHGALNGDHAGNVVRAGDLNGDGIDDLVVGASDADVGSPRRAMAGAAYVWFGKGDLAGVKDAAGAAGTAPDLTILGASERDNLTNDRGLTIADVNDDGVSDLLLVSSAADGPAEERPGAGEIYLIYGRQSPETFPSVLDLAEQDGPGADVILYGAATSDSLGLGGKVQIGDVNGDGVADILLSARGTNVPVAGRNSPGVSYLIFGPRSPSESPVSIDLAVQGHGGADVTIYGASSSDGLSVRGVADMNADGTPDVILGASGADAPGSGRSGAGAAYLVFGRQSPARFPATLDVRIPGTDGADVTIYGRKLNDGLTAGGVLTGDVNGDGIPDLLLGAPYGDGPANGRSDAGEAYLVFGRRSPTPFPATLDLALQGSDGADVTFYGTKASDNLTIGGAMAMGDVTGDGTHDIVLGARWADGPIEDRFNAGEAYIILGRTSPAPFPATVDLALQENGAADVTIYGATANDFLTDLGELKLGDVNGDGTLDLLLGTPEADGPLDGRNNAGEAYIIYGRTSPTTFPPTLDLATQGTPGADVTLFGGSSGNKLSGGGALEAGDVNGDGVPDFLLGAVQARGPGGEPAGVGAAYVLYGVFPSGGTPEFSLRLPAGTGNELGHGETRTFGGVESGSSADRVFSVRNLGSAPLEFSGEPNPVILSGPDAADFSVAAQPAESVDSLGTTSFTVRFTPSSPGFKEATLSMPNNDPDEGAFILHLTGTDNVAPTDIALSGTTLEENAPPGSTVGLFSASDANDGQSHSFRFAAGPGDDDNARFSLIGNALSLNRSPDFESQNSYTVRVRATDDGFPTGRIEESFTVTITNVTTPPDAPFANYYDLSKPPHSALNAPGLVAYGALPSDGAGSVVRAADLNGDGIDDLIVGAPSADVGTPLRANAGAVYVWFGEGALAGTKDAAGIVGTAPNVAIHGASGGDGLSLGGALVVGDFNGDGTPDLGLGAGTADGPANARLDAGEVYLVFGRASPAIFPSTIDLAEQGDAGANVTIYGATIRDRLTFGGAMKVGDFNADETSDLLLGAYQADGPEDEREDAGEAYLVFGRKNPNPFPATLDLALQGTGGADVTIYGATENDLLTLGGGLEAGDLNGDGTDDIVLGAAYGDGPAETRTAAGDAYLIFGRNAPSSFPVTLDLAIQGETGADVTLYGATAFDNLTLDGALTTGDINGDSIPDLLLGAAKADGLADGRIDAGEAYLIFGRAPPNTFTPTIDLGIQGLGGADVTIQGASAGDNLTNGGALATGDVNGDGTLDILLGAPFANGPLDGRIDAGEAYIVFGRSAPAAFTSTLDLAVQGSAGADVTIYGATTDDSLTRFNAPSASDLSGDGTADLLLAASNGDGPEDGRNGSGEAYIVYGIQNPASFPSTIDLAEPNGAEIFTTLFGPSAGDGVTSYRALTTGDVNGDGATDLLVGAANADGPEDSRAGAGEAYVLFGIPSTIPPTPFQAWATAHNVVADATTLLAFAFDTTPGANRPLRYTGTFAGGGTIAATGSPIATSENSGDAVEYRALYVRRSDYLAAGLSYTPLFSASLNEGDWSESEATPEVLADDGSNQIVSVPYPAFASEGGSIFFRVTVSIAP